MGFRGWSIDGDGLIIVFLFELNGERRYFSVPS